MQITSGKFEADLFVMTNSTQFTANATYQMPATEVHTLTQAGTCTLANTPVANSISITGFHETASTPTAGSGEFKIENKTLTFAPEDVDGQITISYMYETTAQEANIDNRSSAIGEAVLVYPVYGDAADCNIQSSIIGHVIMKVYKARITAQPGLDGSLTYINRFPAQ